MPADISFESKGDVLVKEPKLESNLSRLLGNFGDAVLLVLVFLFPLFFLSNLQDPLGISKQILLLALTTIAGILWLCRVFSSRNLIIRKSFFFLPLILYVVVLGISTITSIDRYTSLFGGSANEYASLATLIGFSLFLFFAVTSPSDLKFLRNSLLALFASNILIGIATIVKLFGGALPFVPAGATWNTIGSIFALGIFAAVLLVLASGLMLLGKENNRIFLAGSGRVLKVAAFLAGIINLFLLLVLDWWVAWFIVIVGVGLLLAFVFVYAHSFKNLTHLMLGLAAFVIAILFLFVRTPINLNIPVEVAPGHGTSWQIAERVLRESPALGSGPSTYVFDYVKNRPEVFANTLLWNFRFDRGSSFVLTMLPTIGIAGMMVWLLLIAVMIGIVIRGFLKERDITTRLLNVVVFLPWLSLLVSRFFYNSNMPLEFLFWFLTGLIVIINSRKLSSLTFSASPRAMLGTSFGAIVFAVLMVILLLMGLARTLGWTAFARAVESNSRGDLEKTKEELARATDWDPRTDVFARNLAQVRFFEARQANSVANLQNLLNAAVGAARYAVGVGSVNSLNWSMLGSVYSEMSGVVTGSGELALQAFEKSRDLDPRNPMLPTEAGKVEVVLADVAERDAGSRDEAVRRGAEARVTEHLNNAERLFSEAISLKRDYAPAHFYMAVVFRRRGNLDEAISKMESVARYNPRDVGVAFQLGLLYLEKRNPAKAEAEFKRALQLAPNYSNARWYLASIYESQGKTSDAIREVEAILAANSDNQAVKDRLESLRRGQRAAELPPPVQEEGRSLEP